MSSQAGDLVILTAYPGLILKGFYNNRRDSSVYVYVVTAEGDTANLSVPSETPLWKLPVIAKIFKTGTTDSVYGLFQKR